eukprot:671870-Amphidinium_carterae.1
MGVARLFEQPVLDEGPPHRCFVHRAWTDAACHCMHIARWMCHGSVHCCATPTQLQQFQVKPFGTVARATVAVSCGPVRNWVILDQGAGLVAALAV